MNWTTGATPVVFNQLQMWTNMAINQDAVPTGASPYVWTSTWNPAVFPTVEHRTLERRITDGTNHDDDEFLWATAQSLQLNYQQGDVLMMNCSGFAGGRTNSTLTAGQALPTINTNPSTLSKVWIDSTWANLGTTVVAAQVLSWDFSFTNGLRPLMSADARTDFTVDVLNDNDTAIDFTMDVLVDTNAAQYSIEQTAAEALTLRAIRVEVVGAGNSDLTISFLAKHVQGSMYEISEQDGLTVVRMTFQESHDGTNFLETVLTNDQATNV